MRTKHRWISTNESGEDWPCHRELSPGIANSLGPGERETELKGGDTAPGSHEVLLPWQLEVGCAGGVVRHHHVDIPGQHRTPQQLLSITVSNSGA